MPRPLRFCDGVVYVPLTKGYEAKIDLLDVPSVMQHDWYARVQPRTVYAERMDATVQGKRKRVKLHRVVLPTPDGLQVDHINLDGLDCRRANLRHATPSQNGSNQRIKARNKSGFKGVIFVVRRKKWMASIGVNGKDIFLGYFSTDQDAHVAYVNASRAFHGEFGRIS